MKIQQLAENNTEGAGINNLQTAAQTLLGQSCERLYQKYSHAAGLN